MMTHPESASDPRGVTKLLGAIGAVLLRALGATWRVRIDGPDPFDEAAEAPVLGALLHRDFLMAAWFFRDRGIRVGISRSRDGDLIDQALAQLGYAEAARGSSSRGGAVAQLGLLRALEAGGSVAVVVDGPRGPAGQPKPGIARLATRTGRPISAVTFRARFAWRFGSWDSACLPLPFARVECLFSAPIHADESGDGEGESRVLHELASRLAGPTRTTLVPG